MKTSHGLVMDGFMKGGSGAGNTQNKTPKITEASNLLSRNAASTKLKSAAQGVHNRAQRSQTLMRSAVKKPVTLAKSANEQIKHPSVKTRTHHVDQSRLNRIQTIDKNNKVRRFGHSFNTQQKNNRAPVKSHVGEVVSHSTEAKSTSNSTAVSKPLPSMVTSASHQHLERLLDEALTRADSHKKTLRGQMHNQSLWQKVKHAPRWLSIGTALAVLVLITGFIAINKVPQVAVRVAATRAHINAKVPAFVPSGFSFAGPVSYSDGNVNIKYTANDSSGREFTISQTSSKMSSKSLEDKVVPRDTQVQTSVVNGTTVYIYGATNDAAWVNHGIQYTVSDKANLNSDQLLKIANSL